MSEQTRLHNIYMLWEHENWKHVKELLKYRVNSLFNKHCACKYWRSTWQLHDPSETHIDLETDGTVTRYSVSLVWAFALSGRDRR